MKARAYLHLARASNLPTVASNVLCGLALAGAQPPWWTQLRITMAMALFYTAGMFLNDAFDRNVDRIVRPTRPIPSGTVGAGEVFAVGAALLALGVGLLAVTRSGLWVGALLAAFIVAYDAWHKATRWAPLLMGACRALVYLGAAAAAAGPTTAGLVLGAALLFCYVLGLSWWSRRGGAHVGPLIAGISILDALLIASTGRIAVAALALACCAWTILAQRRVPGT